MIGEIIYQALHNTYGELTGKITGMLLTINEEALIETVSNPALL